MNWSRGRRSVLAAAVVAVLLLAGIGCGDDGGDDEGTSGGGTTEATAQDDSSTSVDDPYGQSSETTGGQGQSGDAVSMADIAFTPATLTVDTGTEVTWTNEDDTTHTTTSDDDIWDSGDLEGGDTFSYTFDEAGTFTYVCEIHASMTGEIVVE